MLKRMLGDKGLFDPTYFTTRFDAESLPGHAKCYRMDSDHAAGSTGLRDASNSYLLQANLFTANVSLLLRTISFRGFAMAFCKSSAAGFSAP